MNLESFIYESTKKLLKWFVNFADHPVKPRTLKSPTRPDPSLNLHPEFLHGLCPVRVPDCPP